jgi:hypothetical protein
MTGSELRNYVELDNYRGFSIMVRIDEEPTKWCVYVKTGAHKDDMFILKLSPVCCEFERTEGLLNRLVLVVDEAKGSIDKLVL